MSKYTLIASRDPFESRDVETLYTWARDLKSAGHEVTLFLVQNGVLHARKDCAAAVQSLAEAGVAVVADEFSLGERGIAQGSLPRGIQSESIDVIVDHLADGRKVIWH